MLRSREIVHLASASVLALALAAVVPAARAAEGGEAPEWKGYAGAGGLAFPRYAGSRSVEALPVPLLTFEYREVVYVDLLRAGVRFWSSADRKLALGVAAEPRFGHRAGDSLRLAGTARRRDSIEAGPTLEWETPVASLSLAWFGDATRASGGTSLRAALYRQVVDSARWDVGVYAALDRTDARATNFYFGVRPEEAAAARPAYQPGSTTHASIGISAAWSFGVRHALLFGAQGTRLGGAAAASPIVETRRAPMGYVGLGWRL